MENKEKVVMEAKLEGGADSKKFKINENQAIVDIAKSLIQDFTFTITLQITKIVLSNIKNSNELVDAVKEVWKKRTSAQLAEEQQKYQDAINAALSGGKEITEDTSKKIDEYMKSYCSVRDKAVEIANNAVNDIINVINQKEESPKNEEVK